MAPGIIGVSGGRPRPSGNMVHFSVLVDKAAVIPRSIVGLQEQVTKYPFSNVTTQQSIPPLPKPSVSAIWDGKPLGKTKVSLIKICLARSGDKGDSANIGVICRKPEFYQYLDKHLTEEVVAAHLAHLMTSNSVVKKFHLPGIYAFNFLVTQCLGGGGLSSLRIDRQGKSYGQLLLSLELDVPTEWLVEHSNL